MAKLLNDVLKGTKSSTIVPGSTGTKPGVDYSPKSAGDDAFVAKHSTEKHDDRTKNGPDVFSGAKVKHVPNSKSNKGHDDSEKVYEEDIQEAIWYGLGRGMSNDVMKRETARSAGKCIHCLGTGKLKPKKNSKETITCTTCKGSGKLMEEADMKCAGCGEVCKDADALKEHKANCKAVVVKESMADRVKAALSVDEASKDKPGYQLWPGQKKKPFFTSKETSDETKKWAEKKKAEREAAEKNKKPVEEATAFDKLKRHLSHEKGVTDPAALAAAIGRKKYGAKEFQHKVELGKQHANESEDYDENLRAAEKEAAAHKKLMAQRTKAMDDRANQAMAKVLKDKEKKPANEEVIDELSKETLGSYVVKANKDYGKTMAKMAEPDSDGTEGDRLNKRYRGIKQAQKKLANEHVDGDPNNSRTELKALANKAMSLHHDMPDYMHSKPWVQQRIDTAKQAISDVHDHMMYGDHEAANPEQAETPNTLPGYAAGSVSGV